MSLPSALDLIEEALKINSTADVNSIHSNSYNLMLKYRRKYYEQKADDFLSRPNLTEIPSNIKKILRTEMLSPMVANDVQYTNFMEEASRRISQTFQVVSGNIAELCVERELNKLDLIRNINYKKRIKRTDLMIYSPTTGNPKKEHRVEIKNVKLRERGTRGLAFDGDSMFGFFDSPNEFTESNVKIIDEHCSRMKGYCYLPPDTIQKMQYHGKCFKPNIEFGKDMLFFVKNGKMP
jgi:hypothetical protein